MKSTHLIHWLVLASYCLTGFTIAQNKALPQQGLVAYYPFDGNTEDKSGQKNHGKIQGGVHLDKDRFGNPCRAMAFNGKDGYISIQNSASLQSPVDGLSINSWFKISRDSPFADLKWVTVCCKSNSSQETPNSPQYRFQSTKVTFSINTDFTENWTQNLDFDRWYFYTLTYDGRKVEIYLNAQKVMNFYYAKKLTPNDLPLEIGRDRPGVEEYFAGVLDDIRIYNRPLTKTEIEALYNDTSNKNTTTNPCDRNAVATNGGLPTKIGRDVVDYQQTVHVKSDQITVYLYDHEQEDGDIVSINFDGVWVLDKHKIINKKKKLSRNKHLRLKLVAEETHYLISKAWNVGSKPPNTLTLEIHDGVSDKPQIVTLNSRVGKSGAIRLRYDPFE